MWRCFEPLLLLLTPVFLLKQDAMDEYNALKDKKRVRMRWILVFSQKPASVKDVLWHFPLCVCRAESTRWRRRGASTWRPNWATSKRWSAIMTADAEDADRGFREVCVCVAHCHSWAVLCCFLDIWLTMHVNIKGILRLNATFSQNPSWTSCNIRFNYCLNPHLFVVVSKCLISCYRFNMNLLFQCISVCFSVFF